MGSDSEKPGSFIALNNERSSFSLLRYLGLAARNVVTHILHEELQNDYKVEICMSCAIPLPGSDLNVPKSKQKIRTKYAEPPNAADRELLNSTSETKAMFSEILHSLDLFENYVQWPSEKTAKLLKLSLDRPKSAYNELLTPDNIDKFVEIIRTFLIKKCSQDVDNENEKPQDFDHKSANSANRNLDYDLHLDSQPHSISEEVSQLDLENEKSSSFSSNFENNKNSFENTNINKNEKYNKVKSNATQTNNQKIFENNLVQPSHEPKTKLKQEPRKIPTTKSKDSSIKGEIVSFDQDSSICQLRDKDKSNHNPEHRIYQNSGMIDDAFPYVNKGKQGKDIDKYIEYSSTEKGILYEKMSEENALESRNCFQFQKAQVLIAMETLRVKELEEKNLSQQKQLESLKIKHEEILAEFGEFTVQKTAKENKERKSELFQRIFPSSLTEAKRSAAITCNGRPINDEIIEDQRLGYPNGYQNCYQKSSHGNGSTSNGSPNGFSNAQTTIESDDHPPFNASVAFTAATGEKRVQRGDRTLFQESNHQPRTQEMLTRDKDDQQSSAMIQQSQNPAMQNSSNITSREKTSGGEGTNQSGKRKEVKGHNVLASTSKDESTDQSSTRRSYEDLPFSVQQDDSNAPEYISLRNIPPTSVATTLYNNYKLLLLSLAERLLSSEVIKLKDWATQTFSIENPQNTTDVLFQLDQKGVINASDLSKLCDFFESIVRIDLLYVIDAFLLGDYSLLREIPASKKRDANRPQNPQNGTTSRYPSFSNAVNNGQSSVNSPSRGTLQSSAARNPAASRKPENSNGRQTSIPQQTQKEASPNFSISTNPKLFSRSPNENQSTTHEQPTGFTPARMSDVIRVDGPVTNERRTTASSSITRTNPSVENKAGNTQTVGSNGSKHSKFQRADTERGNANNSQSPAASRNHVLYQEDNWLCNHYKRHCYVKFECCEQFWPCHRCHNNQSSCGRRKLKSRDTKMVKCVYCKKVQQFGQFCCDCGAQFANYYCGLCKHLTGGDDHPYHCEKCGICRIHGDRSFHCDICGVCLDVQLRGNHKCREDSAHDECCICLEDAFTGCQILPCSHKVHKECATQMIRSGITRCPICRESFAHKLERRPPNSGKRSEK